MSNITKEEEKIAIMVLKKCWVNLNSKSEEKRGKDIEI